MKIRDAQKRAEAQQILDAPGEYDPAQVAELRRAVESYDAENSLLPASITNLFGEYERNLGATRESIGPRAAEALAPIGGGVRVSGAPLPGSRPTALGTTRVSEMIPEDLAGLEAGLFTERPGLGTSTQQAALGAEALGIPEPPPLEETEPEPEGAVEIDEYGNVLSMPEFEAPEAKYYNPDLLNLSKDQRFSAPIGQFEGSLWKTRVAYEPSVDYVKQVLMQSPSLMDAVRNPSTVSGIKEPINLEELTEDSPEYKRAADAIWMQRLEEARQTKTPLMRSSQLDPSLSGAFLEWVVTPASQFALNFERGATFGFLSNAATGIMNAVTGAVGDPAAMAGAGNPLEVSPESMAELRDTAHPLLSLGGQMGGAMSPGGLPSRFLGTAMAATGTAPVKAGIAGLTASGLGRSAGLGAATGMFEGVGRDVADVGSGVKAWNQVGDTMWSDAAWGGGLGFLGDLAGAGAGELVKKIERQNPEFIEIQRAGGNVTPMGRQLPERLQKIIDDAELQTKTTPAKVSAIEELGESAGASVRAGGDAHRRAVVNRVGTVKSRYYKTKEAKRRVGLNEMWAFVSDQIKARTKDHTLTGPDIEGRDNSGLRALLATMSVPTLVRRANRRAPRGGVALDYSDAQKLLTAEQLEAMHAAAPPGTDRQAILPDAPPTDFFDRPTWHDKYGALSSEAQFPPGSMPGDILAEMRGLEIRDTVSANYDRTTPLIEDRVTDRFTGQYNAPFVDEYPTSASPGAPAPELPAYVTLAPRKVNAKEADEIIASIDDLTKSVLKGDAPTIRRVHAVAREIRKNFRGNPETGGLDWAEMNRAFAQELGDMQQTLAHAGLKDKPLHEYTAAEIEAGEKVVRSYRTGKLRSKADKALAFLLTLTGDTKGMKELQDIAATGGLEGAQQKVTELIEPRMFGSKMMTRVAPGASTIQQLAYPALRNLGSSLDSGVGVVHETPKLEGLHDLPPKVQNLFQNPPAVLKRFLVEMRKTSGSVARLGAAGRTAAPFAQGAEDVENMQIFLDVLRGLQKGAEQEEPPEFLLTPELMPREPEPEPEAYE